MKILLLNGSASRVSHTKAFLTVLEQQFVTTGTEVTLVNLVEQDIPTVMPEFHDEPMNTPHAGVRDLIRSVSDADAVILGTPIYHGSYSGLLKNVLDSLPGDAFAGKIVGLVSNAGGVHNPQACEHLRSIVRTMQGLATQTQIVTSQSDFTKTPSGYSLHNEKMYERSRRLVEEIIYLTQALQQMKT